MEPHLQPVQESHARPRADARKRPSKSVPTDRMKFDVQERVLQTLGRMSGPSKRAVNAQQLAAAMNGEVSHYTVGLSHNFFVDCGWLERRGRGEYAAADSLVAYTTRLAGDPTNLGKAVEALREAVYKSWAWRAIVPQIGNGGAPIPEVMVTLMQEAQVGEAHKPQLRNLLEWLRYVGAAEISEDKVRTSTRAANTDDKPDDKPHHSLANSDREQSSPAAQTDPKGEKSTTSTPGKPGVVLALDFQLQITGDDLAKLAPEQIKAVFEAVGVVMSVKGL